MTIIGCTSYANDDVIKEAIISGMSAVLKKPIKREDLLKFLLKSEIL